MATMEEYKARILAYTEGKDPLAMQRETPHLLAKLIDGVPARKLSERPSPDKWSVVEIIAHLAEDEITSTWRYRQMVESDGLPLPGFDQELWARLGDYASWSVDDALTMFRLLREANVRMFSRLAPEEWERHGKHAERGPMTVRELARQMAGHDRNHVEQIERILGKSASRQSGAA
jgi:hypothetical protein